MPWPKGRKLSAEHRAKVAERVRERLAADPELRRQRAEKSKATWTERRRRDQATYLFEHQTKNTWFEARRRKALAAWLKSDENAAKLARFRRSPGFEARRSAAFNAKYPPLPPMTDDERKIYRKLRRCGVDRDAALKAASQQEHTEATH